MNIAFDIDGVLNDMDGFTINYAKPFFKKQYNKDIVNEKAFHIKEIFDCSDKEEKEFWKKYLLFFFMKYPARKNAASVIKKLHDDGDKIYIITSRIFTSSATLGPITRKLVKNWLKDNEITYDNIEFCSLDEYGKVGAVQKYNIDVIVEDMPGNIKILNEITKPICFNSLYNKDYICDYIPKVDTFEEVYDEIQNIKQEQNKGAKSYGKRI